jgi:hypothetical protein
LIETELTSGIRAKCFLGRLGAGGVTAKYIVIVREKSALVAFLIDCGF